MGGGYKSPPPIPSLHGDGAQHPAVPRGIQQECRHQQDDRHPDPVTPARTFGLLGLIDARLGVLDQLLGRFQGLRPTCMCCTGLGCLVTGFLLDASCLVRSLGCLLIGILGVFESSLLGADVHLGGEQVNLDTESVTIGDEGVEQVARLTLLALKFGLLLGREDGVLQLVLQLFERLAHLGSFFLVGCEVFGGLGQLDDSSGLVIGLLLLVEFLAGLV